MASQFSNLFYPQICHVYTAGWWFGKCLIWHSVGNFIFPTDELIFFRGVGLNHQPDHVFLQDFTSDSVVTCRFHGGLQPVGSPMWSSSTGSSGVNVHNSWVDNGWHTRPGKRLHCNGNLWEFMVVYIMGSNGFYLLVNVYLMNWKVTMLLMGKSTINKCPFSIAMLNYQRVSIHIWYLVTFETILSSQSTS